MLLGGILCFLVAAVLILFPEVLYSLFLSWRIWDESGEPPAWYLWYTRVGAGFLAVAGIFLLIGHFTS